MRNLKRTFAALTGACLLASAAIMPATAAGFLTNGLPVAGGSQYPTTLPLTGLETIPADTNLTGGLNPASEAITTLQLSASANILNPVVFGTAINTTGFTATTAQVDGGKLVVLSLTGTLGAGAALTLPTAAALVAATPGVGVGYTYVIRFINNSSANFAWTITAGTGDTVTGTATVAQNVFREYRVNFTNVTAGSEAVTLQNIGAGAN